MMRPTSLVLMLLAAAAGGALFHVSFEVTALDDRLSTLNRDIRTDREAIHVLRAEWGFLKHLFAIGRETAQGWLDNNFDDLGNRSTVDIRDMFGGVSALPDL